MNPATAMKTQILADLQSLVPTYLTQVISSDMSRSSLFDQNFSGYPAAIVIPPLVPEARYEDTASNIRQYNWTIIVVQLPENLATTPLETTMDAVFQLFDQDYTLGGTAVGGALPSIIDVGPIAFSGKTYATFYLTIRAQALVSTTS